MTKICPRATHSFPHSLPLHIDRWSSSLLTWSVTKSIQPRSFVRRRERSTRPMSRKPSIDRRFHPRRSWPHTSRLLRENTSSLLSNVLLFTSLRFDAVWCFLFFAHTLFQKRKHFLVITIRRRDPLPLLRRQISVVAVDASRSLSTRLRTNLPYWPRRWTICTWTWRSCSRRTATYATSKRTIYRMRWRRFVIFRYFFKKK